MEDRKLRGHLEDILKPLPPLCWIFYANLDVHTAKVSKLTSLFLYIQMMPSQELKFRETRVKTAEPKILLFAHVVIPLCPIKICWNEWSYSEEQEFEEKKTLFFINFCKT